MFTAAEDTVILKRGKEFKNAGVHCRLRTILDEIDRFSRGVLRRHQTLNGDELKMSKITGCNYWM